MVKKLKKKLTQEQLEYLRGQPNHRKKRLLKDPCWPSTESPECVKLMIKDNPWMLEKGGDKYVEKVVGKKSLINKEIKKKKKTKKHKGGKYKQDFEKNEGYFGKIMNEKTGKLNSEEICHNCLPSAYAKGARKFCKIHGKIWNPKTNSCRDKKNKPSKKQKGQKGGALCLPCISPVLSGLGVIGAGAAATGAVAAGVKGISMTKSKMSSSNGKIIREQYFDKSLSKTHSKGSKMKKKKKTKRKEDKLKFYIKQENNVVSFKKNDEKLQKKIFNKSKNMKENIKKATDFYDKKIHYCVVKGYRKC